MGNDEKKPLLGDGQVCEGGMMDELPHFKNTGPNLTTSRLCI